MTRPGPAPLVVLILFAFARPGQSLRSPSAAVDFTMAAAPSVVQLAADYVAGYQRELTEIVADEVVVQDVRASGYNSMATTRSRTTRGEIFFIFATPERQWMAVRDVAEVDGEPAPRRGDVREALATLSPREVAERMRSFNARYNVGPIQRNVNEPTLALLSLDATHRPRFKFNIRAREQSDGRELTRVTFEEKERPTLVRSVSGKPVFIAGELRVEAATGRIWNTALNALVDGVHATLRTEYRDDPRLRLLLPAVFRESYSRTDPATNSTDRVLAEATYSNYRRFDVLSRVK